MNFYLSITQKYINILASKHWFSLEVYLIKLLEDKTSFALIL